MDLSHAQLRVAPQPNRSGWCWIVTAGNLRLIEIIVDKAFTLINGKEAVKGSLGGFSIRADHLPNLERYFTT
jgi:hypothetical protein